MEPSGSFTAYSIHRAICYSSGINDIKKEGALLRHPLVLFSEVCFLVDSNLLSVLHNDLRYTVKGGDQTGDCHVFTQKVASQVSS